MSKEQIHAVELAKRIASLNWVNIQCDSPDDGLQLTWIKEQLLKYDKEAAIEILLHVIEAQQLPDDFMGENKTMYEFKNLAQYTQSQQESQPDKETTYYRTVKASERLPDLIPDRSEIFYCRNVKNGSMKVFFYGKSSRSFLSSQPWNWEWLEPIPSPESDAVEFKKIERFETRLMLYKLIKWAKSDKGKKVPELVSFCEMILQKWSRPGDALK